jgi:hypothetical protein
MVLHRPSELAQITGNLGTGTPHIIKGRPFSECYETRVIKRLERCSECRSIAFLFWRGESRCRHVMSGGSRISWPAGLHVYRARGDRFLLMDFILLRYRSPSKSPRMLA